MRFAERNSTLSERSSFPGPLSMSMTLISHASLIAIFSIALSFSVPVLAATLAFVTYTQTSHSFDVAIIFASLSLFTLLRQPLLFLPRALSGIADARSAFSRLQHVFLADLRVDQGFEVDTELDVAVRIKAATFEWEESVPQETIGGGKESKKGSKAHTKGSKKEKKHAKDTEKETKTDVAPFRVRDIDLEIPRGQLVAIVGPVGSGKVCHSISEVLA